MTEPSRRGPILRIVCVNDVYSLENLPRLATLVRHYASAPTESGAAAPDAFLAVLAGDFIGPSMLSSLDKGRGMIEALNEVGITHVSFGNHEDDVDSDDLRERIAEFRGIWLNSNIPSYTPKLPGYDIVKVTAPSLRTVRVGLLGVVMQDQSVYRRKPFGGAPIEPANATAMAAAERLVREEGCACVIPLTHQDLSDDRALAASQRTPRFPLIIGGHEHEVAIEEIEGTWLVKAGTDAVHAAVVELAFAAEAPASGPDLPSVCVRLEAVANYAEEAPLRARVNARMTAVHELEAATLIRLPDGETLSSVGTRARQTSLGTLLSSRIRDTVGSEGCLLNGGGIRGSRTYRERFTYGDLKTELPFENEICVVTLPGRVLAEAIAASRAQAPVESGGFLQVDDQMLVEEPRHVLTKVAGAPLCEERLYRIAIMRNLMTGMDHIEPLVRYTQEHPECLPAEGCGRGIKVVLVDAFSRELWKQLGLFEAVDTDRDGLLSEREIADAVTRVTASPASRITVDLLIRAADANRDRVISREEAKDLWDGEKAK